MTTPTRGNDETANEPPELEGRAREPWWRRPVPIAVFLVALVAVSLWAVQLDRRDPVLVPRTDRFVRISRGPAQGDGFVTKPPPAATRQISDPSTVARLRHLIDHTAAGAYEGFGCFPGDIRYRLDFAVHSGAPTDTTVVVHDGGCHGVTVTRGHWRHVGHESNFDVNALLRQLTS